MPKVLNYEEKKYIQKRHLYDCIVQAFEDVKTDLNGQMGGWNLPVEEVKGVSLRLVGDEHIELTYHHYEITTIEGLAVTESKGPTFLKDVVKSLKKKFRKLTGKTLNLKVIKESQAIDKVSRIQADTSWMIGSSRYGFGSHPRGRYLVKDSCVYSFDASVEP